MLAGPTDRADVGDQITYSFSIENTGNVTLDTVELDDALVNFAGESCNDIDGILAPGETTNCTAVYNLTQTDIDNGSIANTATTYGNPPAGDPADRGDDASDSDGTTTTILAAPAIDLVKTASAIDLMLAGPTDRADAGDQITYSFSIENTGNVTLDTVELDDALVNFAGESCNDIDGILAPGETTNCTAVYNLTQTDIDNGSIANTATTYGNPPAGDPADRGDDASDSDGTTTTILAAPAIDLVKTASAIDLMLAGPTDRADAGDQITYSFSIENTGNVTLDTVELDDALVSFAGESCNDIDGILAPGETTSCTAVYTLTQTDIDNGSIANTAFAYGNPPAGDPADRGDDADDSDGTTTSIPQDPSILADKVLQSNADEDGSNDVSLNDTLSYKITATNDGNVTLTNVTVDDNLTGTTDAFCAASLAPGESCQVVVSYVVTQADVDAGQIDNIGTVEGTDPNDEPQTDDDPESVDVPQFPEISIVKTFADDSVIAGGAGSSFTLVVTNEGNVTLSDALIEDTVDSRLTVTGVSGTLGADADSDVNAQTVEWLISTLGVGQSATITVNFAVDSSVPAATVNNISTVGAEAPQGDPGDPADDIIATDDDYHRRPDRHRPVDRQDVRPDRSAARHAAELHHRGEQRWSVGCG